MPKSGRPLPNPSELEVRLETGAVTTALVYAGAAAGAALILGHGAGAGQRSAFMVDFAHALSALGVDVVTFNFLYTEQGRKIPDRAPALLLVAAVFAGRTGFDPSLLELQAPHFPTLQDTLEQGDLG